MRITIRYLTRWLLGLAGLVVAATAVYLGVVRPWQLTWGATDAEVLRPLPGDDFLLHPTFDATRAVTINAGPERIWPWIVQIGLGRAGWYSYDLIDNLGRASADEILPEFQDLEVGDLIPISPDGKLVRSWGKPGNKPGEFYLPHDVCVTADSRVLVADRENDRIQVFTLEGKLIEEWTHLQRPTGISQDPQGNIYVSNLWWRVGQKSQVHGSGKTQCGQVQDIGGLSQEVVKIVEGRAGRVHPGPGQVIPDEAGPGQGVERTLDERIVQGGIA